MFHRRAPTLLDAATTIGCVVGMFLACVLVVVGAPWGVILFVVVAPFIAMIVLLLQRAVQLTRWYHSGESGIITRIYEHVDDTLGAGRYEARRSMRIQRRMDIAVTILTLGTNRASRRRAAYPAHRPQMIQQTRIRRYVSVTFTEDRRRGQKYDLPQVESVTLRWTSEVRVQPDSWWRMLEQMLAQALRLKWHEHMFEMRIGANGEPDPSQWLDDVVTYRRRDVQAVPPSLTAADDLEDDLEDEEAIS